MASTKLGSIYFNEIDFIEPPVFSGESDFTYKKDITPDHIMLKVVGHGMYMMQVATRRNAAGKMHLTISIYDDQFRLAERKERLLSELVSAVQKGPEALEELIVSDIRGWLEEDYPDFCNLLVSSIGRAVEGLVKASKSRAKEHKPANELANQQHKIYHAHRIHKTTSAA